MNALDKVFLVLAVVFFITVVYEVGNRVTGLAVHRTAPDTAPPVITLTKVDAGNDSAKLSWETNKTANSTFFLNGEATVMSGMKKKFELKLHSLSSERQYSYRIYACDAGSNCYSYQGTFSTIATQAKGTEPPAVTGNVVARLEKLQSSVSSLIFLLLAVVVSFVVIGAGIQRLDDNELAPHSMRLGVMLGKAEAAIKSSRHDTAYPLYEKMRYMYEKLNSKEKGKHQKRVLDVYSELYAHARAKEANYLADKYLEGTITNEEMARLRELLES